MPEADVIILDLEDGVAPNAKQRARANIKEAIPALHSSGKEVFVRINALNSMAGIRDLMEVTVHVPDALVLPKADAKMVSFAGLLLSAVEAEANLALKTRIIPLVETSAAIVNVYATLSASSRVDGVIFGAQDYMNDLGVSEEDGEQLCMYARNAIVNAAAARHVDAYDSPSVDFKTLEVYTKEAQQAKRMGFAGKTAIHPCVLSAIHEAYQPSPEALQEAREILNAFEAAQREGRGACSRNGKMLDLPIILRARRLLEE